MMTHRPDNCFFFLASSSPFIVIIIGASWGQFHQKMCKCKVIFTHPGAPTSTDCLSSGLLKIQYGYLLLLNNILFFSSTFLFNFTHSLTFFRDSRSSITAKSDSIDRASCIPATVLCRIIVTQYEIKTFSPSQSRSEQWSFQGPGQAVLLV